MILLYQNEDTMIKTVHDGTASDAVFTPSAIDRSVRKPFDVGASWSEILRFTDVTFSQGGTFKLCFCDSLRSGDCGDKSDYVVDLGTVHVSGVSCLIKEDRFQRYSCRSHWGTDSGLTCTESYFLFSNSISSNFTSVFVTKSKFC